MTMNPSRPSLAAKLDALDPARFQALAEDYVALKFPGRFENLQRRGSNIAGETIAGWPDAYATTPDGRLDILEVTHGDTWRDHLLEDIGKADVAELKGQIAGFVFVAWARTPKPEISLEFQNKLISLGIPGEQIALIFQEQLVSDLCEAKFALLWEKYLELRAHSLPFYPIDQAPIYGSVQQASIFTPAREEYAQGLVHRPSIASLVEERMQTRGWTLVRGKGASGKTVMAAHIARGPRFRGFPVYYLDLENFVSTNEAYNSSRALDVITWRKDAGVLFIVDNVHLAEQTAREILDYWWSVRSGSFLLLLGRWTEAGPGPRGIAAPLATIDQEPLTLEVNHDDLLGVLRRLGAREGIADQIQKPPEEIKARWLALFGGDLIAFSAAVAHRLPRIASGEWELTAEDARQYVRDTYLYPQDDPLTDNELHNLFVIASLSKLELETPYEALQRGDLRTSLQTGIVHRTESGRDKIVRFRLVHPGLGELLLSAANPPIEENNIYQEFALTAPSSALFLASRLDRLGQRNSAMAIARLICEQDSRLLAALFYGGNFNITSGFCNLLKRLEIHSLEATDEILSSYPESLITAAVNTPLDHLKNFLSYTQQQLPKTLAVLRRTLADPVIIPKLVAVGLHTPPQFLPSALAYLAGHNDFDVLYKAIVAGLTDPSHLSKFVEAALDSPIYYFPATLDYLGKYTDLKLLHESVIAALTDPANFPRLLDVSLRSQLDQLVAFLGYLERQKDLKLLHRPLAASVSEPANLPKLVTTAFQSSLDALVSFLTYTELKSPKAYAALVSALLHPDNLSKLVETASYEGLGALISFFRFSLNRSDLQELPPKILSTIDQSKWNRIRLASLPDQPTAMHAAATLFRQLGHSELMVAPAQAAILRADVSSWHAPGTGIHHLGETLRFGRGVPRDKLEPFLVSVVTEPWLKDQYETATAGATASTLFITWAYYDELVISRFFTGALGTRLAMELSHLSYLHELELGGAISLFGCCSLIAPPFAVSPKWPTTKQIGEMLRFFDSHTTVNQLGDPTVLRWLGIHELARLMPEEIQIAPELGEQVLALWRKAEPQVDRHLYINNVMISWLERCSASNWCLVREPNSLYEAVALETGNRALSANQTQ